MSKIDKFKSKRSIEATRRYKERFVDGGIICNQCNKVKKKSQYHTRIGGYQSYCKECCSENGRKRNQRNKYRLW